MLSVMRTIRGVVVWTLAVLVPLMSVQAQGGVTAGAPEPRERRIKVGASTLIGVAMVGMERALQRPGRTFQWDILVSPWRSVDGYPFTFVVGTAERRAYARADATGGYAALHGGVGIFQLQRWDKRPSTIYHEGGNFMLGGSVGWVRRTRGGWVLDAYVGGGTVQSLYKAYDRVTGSRVDGAKLWNISGELLPYRTGLMVAIPLGPARE